MSELTDIVTRARAGDRQAFADLVRRFQDMAIGYAYSLLEDFHDAEDAAQESFVHAFLDLQALRDPAAFPGWFRTVVRTQCSRTSRRRRPTVSLEEQIMASSQPQPDEMLEDRQRRQAATAALRALPEHELVVVNLFYLGDRSTRDIAAFLGVSVTAVKARLHSARKRMKKELMTMVREQLVSQRPSDDTSFSSKVEEHLDALEQLHRQFASLLEVVLGETLEGVELPLRSVEQRGFGEFVEPLSYPSATYTFQMSPLEGRVVLDMPMAIACAIVDQVSGIDAGRSEGVRDLTLAEYYLLIPTMKGVLDKVSMTWETRFPVNIHDIELETNPQVFTSSLPGAEPYPDAEELVVHLTFDVRSGDTAGSIHLCYPSASLATVLPRIVEGGVAPTEPLLSDAQPGRAAPHFPAVRLTFDEVVVTVADASEAHIVRNMIPLYFHDLSAVKGGSSDTLLPNEHGIMAMGNTRTLGEWHPWGTNAWWKRPGVLLPHLIRVDGRPAGFCLVESPPHHPDGVEHYLNAMFLHRPYRRDDVGERVLREVFGSFAGRWEINVYPRDEEMHALCRSALTGFGSGEFTEETGPTIHGIDMVNFRFEV